MTPCPPLAVAVAALLLAAPASAGVRIEAGVIVPTPESEAVAAGRPRLRPGASWDIQLDDPYDLTRRPDVFGLDLDFAPEGAARMLREAGVTPLCYVSVGTVESYRPDADDFPPEVVGPVYPEWPDERFLDVRQLEILLPLMLRRFERCHEQGFLAVEPDNMDLHDFDVGFPITREDQLAYLRALAGMAHGLGMAIAQKNAPDLIPDLVDDFDFLMLEHCYDSGRCAVAAPYVAAGKAALNVEYDERPVNFRAACAEGAALGVSMIQKDLALTSRRTTCEQL